MRRSRQPLLVLLGCLSFSIYFSTHAINGRYGLEAQRALTSRQAELAQDMARLEAIRSRLRHRTALLAAEPPHPDLVEEVARRSLGYARPRDILIITVPGR